MSTLIYKKLRDSHLFSGSTDLFRTTIGGYYNLVDTGESDDGLEFTFSTCTELSKDISKETDAVIQPVRYPESRLIKNVFMKNENIATTISSSTSMFPFYTIPISIEGNYDFTSEVSAENTDEKWKAYIIGGEYAGENYKGIISQDTFDVTNFNYEYPYPLLYLKSVDYENYGSYIKNESHSKYNYYLQNYQNYNSNASEIGTLNIYDLVYLSQVGSMANPDVKRYISIDKMYNHKDENVFEETVSDYPALSLTQDETFNSLLLLDAGPDAYYDKYEKIRKYLLDLVNPNNNNAGSIKNNENILIDKFSILFTFSQANDKKSYFPFYNKIELPAFSGKSLNRAIVQTKFSNFLLKSIKDTFVEDLYPTNQNDFVDQTVQAGLDSDGNLKNIYSINNVSHKYVDFAQVLAEINNNPNPKLGTNNERYLSPAFLEARAANDYTGLLRHVVKDRAHEMLKDLVENKLSADSSFLNSWAKLDDFSIERFLNLANSSKMNSRSECVALRIKKTNTIDDSVQNIIIQNQPIESSGAGLFSAEDVQTDTWSYYDTQVKYGTPYRYETFAYFMVIGYKYEYSDLAVSRRISEHEQYTSAAIVNRGDAVVAAGVNYTCIEFYDPNTGETRPSPMNTAQNNSMQPVRFNLTTQAAVEGYATEAQELAVNDRINWADFNLKIEPIVRIYEIPIATKELTVMDNPPPKLDVVPYQVKDQSQKIGFYIKLESFSKDTSRYPTPINDTERFMYSRYLNSNNMLDVETVSFATVSEPTTVQVYRLGKKPTKLSDFANNLVTEKSLILENLNNEIHKTYSSSTCFFEERIATSKKFYYAFRFLNENGVPSPWSPVVEAEMIDDGGYKYAVFNTIMESELSDKIKYDNPHDQFKKIFTLRPTIPQIDMNIQNLNYDNTAEEEYNKIKLSHTLSETLFDKKFKIRLTSKKTGKKIDLNVTYNVIDNTDYESI